MLFLSNMNAHVLKAFGDGYRLGQGIKAHLQRDRQ